MNLIDHIEDEIDIDEPILTPINESIDEPAAKPAEMVLETPDIEAEAVNENSTHNVHQHRLLIMRNICVGVAALLFLLSLLPVTVLPHSFVYPLRGIAYLFGAAAYVSELMVLSNLFRHKQAFRHMFMPYVFGVLYLLLGISYLRH